MKAMTAGLLGVFVVLVSAMSFWAARNSISAPGSAGRSRPASTSAVDEGLFRFMWKGKPIHPGAVAPFNENLSDGYRPAEGVDLEAACEHWQRWNGSPEVQEQGYLLSRNPEEQGSGFFKYKHLGCSSKGVHTLIALENTGGSGVWERILFVMFVHDTMYDREKFQDRVLMKLVGEYYLGDRDDGIVQLHGDTLTIGKSRYRDEDTVIRLGDVVP